MPSNEPALEIFLQPGDFYFGDRTTRIRTLLGSCVAITMWHPQRLIGGMCHYMLPSRGKNASGELDGRYADEAIMLFLSEMKLAGTSPRDYQVKLFGGGNMFPSTSFQTKVLVGDRNIQAGKSILLAHGLTPIAEDLGGVGHRNLIFDLRSGEVWVKRPPQSQMLVMAP